MTTPQEVMLDEMPVDKDYLTGVLTNEKLALQQALGFMEAERAKFVKRMADIDAALALRAAEQAELEAARLGRDLHGA